MLTLLIALSGLTAGSAVAVNPHPKTQAPTDGSLYSSVDLGVLPSVADHGAPSLSNSGQVAFWSRTGDDTIHAFSWKNAAREDLGSLPSFRSSVASAINDHSQIVGWSVQGPNIVDSLSAS